MTTRKPRSRKPTDPEAQLRQAVAEYEQAGEALARARTARNEAMAALKATGVSYAAAAEIVGMSPMSARAVILGK